MGLWLPIFLSIIITVSCSSKPCFMNEWLLIAIAIIALFFISTYLRTRINPKTSLLISLVCFAGLMTYFVYHLTQHFSYVMLIVLSIYGFGTIANLYKRYRELSIPLEKWEGPYWIEHLLRTTGKDHRPRTTDHIKFIPDRKRPTTLPTTGGFYFKIFTRSWTTEKNAGPQNIRLSVVYCRKVCAKEKGLAAC